MILIKVEPSISPDFTQNEANKIKSILSEKTYREIIYNFEEKISSLNLRKYRVLFLPKTKKRKDYVERIIQLCFLPSDFLERNAIFYERALSRLNS